MPLPALPGRAWRALPLAVALLCAPAAADASTLGYGADGALEFTGGAGDTWVYLSAADGGQIEIQPHGDAFESVPDGCSSDGETAICPPGGGVRVAMGDGEDQVSVQSVLGVPVTMDGGDGRDALVGHLEGGSETMLGGPGDDRLVARAGDDTVDGGDGGDAIEGGTGSDVLRGGAGADTLTGDEGAARDADDIDGGPGRDVLTGDWHPTSHPGLDAITLTLGGGNDDGFAGEQDDVEGVEEVDVAMGGRFVGTDGGETLLLRGSPATIDALNGDDTVYAGPGPDQIHGGAGADVLRGYGGDDRITGGAGEDTILGDNETTGTTCTLVDCSRQVGNDVIEARDGQRDSINCGAGTDQALVDAIDVVAECEDVQAGGSPGDQPGACCAAKGDGRPAGPAGPAGPATRARLKVVRAPLGRALRRGLTVRLTGARAGRLTLTGRAGRAKVAGCVVRVSADGSGACVLRFTKAGRRSLRRARRVSLRVSGGAGVATTVTLRR